jgi:hypothetical protein
MLRVLQFVLVVFQRFPKRSGCSTRHERDMENEFCRLRSADSRAHYVEATTAGKQLGLSDAGN